MPHHLAAVCHLGVWLALGTFLGGCASRLDDGAGPLAALQAYRLRISDLQLHDATISLTAQPVALAVDHGALEHWIADAAGAVSMYYGRFPVRRVRVVLDSADGHGPQAATAAGLSAPVIRVSLGRGTLASDVAHDWMMTHEMVHLAFPRLSRAHHWLEEGIATYVEPIARVQAGQLDEHHVWRDLVDGLPFGLPQAGDGGLDGATRWGRVYWGGALFCLLADVEIRKQTHNRLGLQDALREIVQSGGNIEVIWPIEQVLAVGDRAAGAPILQQLYGQMRDRPVDVDLDDLWVKLGVRQEGREVRFDDEAPLAAVRRAITARSSAL